MLFGFGRGKMDIHLSRWEYRPREVIEGTLRMELKERVPARGVTIALVGEPRQTHHDAHPHAVKVFKFSVPLDGEKSYNAGEKKYSFAITVPESVKEQRPEIPENLPYGLSRLVRFVSTTHPLMWYVDGKLDVPKSVDVKKRVGINIV